MKRLDMIDQPCPIPVVQAKKALADPATTVLEVLVDNEVAVQNLQKMANGLGYGFSSEKDSDVLYRVTLLKSADHPGASVPAPRLAEAGPAACALLPDAADAGSKTVLITSDCLGAGAEELGKILIKGFIFSLTELDPLPKEVIFLNGGAKLTTEGANTVPDLKALETRGCQIVTCGTCANFYGLTDKLAVGSITDMIGIAARLNAARGLISI